MKKIKYLALLSLSLLILTSCDSVHRSIEREIDLFSEEISDPAKQEEMLEQLANARIASRANNSHVISIGIEIRPFNLIQTGISGYGYYNYNSSSDTATFNLQASGTSNLLVDLDESQKLDINLKILNFDIFNQEDIQLVFDAKPLNEMINLSFINEIDKSVIKRYRKSRFGVDIEVIGDNYDAYVFDLDASYLNSQINNNALKFNSDVVVSVLSDRYFFEEISIIHISGSALINNVINAQVKIYLYNVKPQR
jgi:hypothetical protein